MSGCGFSAGGGGINVPSGIASSGFGINRRIDGQPNPFATFSRTWYPKTMREVFNWAEYMWLHFGIYSQAISKSVRYFLTDIEVFGDKAEPVDFDTRKKYETYLKDNYNILDLLGSIGDDYIAFGNSFTSVIVPIHRNLVCPKCHSHFPIEEIDYNFENFEFVGSCPNKQCNAKDVTFERLDIRALNNDNPIKIIRFNPRNIMIDYCPITGTADYYLDFPDEWRRRIKAGDKVYLRDVPWEFVEAVKNDQVFKFNKEYFKHLRCESAASTIDVLKGWGLPIFMNEFEQAMYVQILDRFNEAIALDYLMPFRVITPSTKGVTVDPIRSANMGNFMATVRSMIQRHRMNPATWNTLPFPVEYQALSGEGSNMAPVELIDRALDNLLTSMGIPQEFYRGSLSAGGNYTPVGLRMFERVWKHYTTNINKWLDWFMGICANLMMWENVTARLVKTSVYEDDNLRQLKMDLAAAEQISKHTAFRNLDIDPDYERERIWDERLQDDKAARENTRKMEEAAALESEMITPPPSLMNSPAMQAAAGGGGGAGGAVPPAGAGAQMPMGAMSAPQSNNAPTSIDDILVQAQQMAQQILGMDPTTRRNQLTTLKKQNPTLHAQVKAELENLEQQAGMQGKLMARQQAAGGM